MRAVQIDLQRSTKCWDCVVQIDLQRSIIGIQVSCAEEEDEREQSLRSSRARYLRGKIYSAFRPHEKKPFPERYVVQTPAITKVQ
jgi:hypothetical protein